MRKFLLFLLLLFPLSAWAQAPVQPVPGTVGGGTPIHYLSTASNNSTNVKATAGTVYQVITINTTATIYYLRLYDLAAAPTCTSATGVKQTYPVPFGQSSSGGGFTIPIPVGMGFLNGIGFCLTSGIADTDNGNAATGIVINFVYQ